ncbi:MAG: LysR family transcriptional regulator [Bacillota bacterium]
MHIECLKYFQQIAKIKSISKVANRSHISQPALSQQIQKLEDALDKKLFIRSNKGVKLTAAGEIVLKYADNISRTYDKMLSDLKEQEKKEIKIEGEFSIATYCLPCALVKMQNKFPSHNYNLISNTSDKIELDVLNDICDIAFIPQRSKENEIISEKIINEKVVMISPTNYELPEKLDLKDVLDYKFIVLKDSCIIKENLKEALFDMGYNFTDLNVISKLETTEAIKTLVIKGYGVAFVPYSAVKDEFMTDELQVSRIKDYNLDYDIFMLRKDSKKLDSKLKEFVKGIKDLGNNICC